MRHRKKDQQKERQQGRTLGRQASRGWRRRRESTQATATTSDTAIDPAEAAGLALSLGHLAGRRVTSRNLS